MALPGRSPEDAVLQMPNPLGPTAIEIAAAGNMLLPSHPAKASQAMARRQSDVWAVVSAIRARLTVPRPECAVPVQPAPRQVQCRLVAGPPRAAAAAGAKAAGAEPPR